MERVVDYVLRENTGMRRLASSLGFVGDRGRGEVDVGTLRLVKTPTLPPGPAEN